LINLSKLIAQDSWAAAIRIARDTLQRSSAKYDSAGCQPAFLVPYKLGETGDKLPVH
jgi:hypothetical protein